MSDLGGEEELDVTGAGPATAPLPKKKISLRTWIIVGAAAVLLVVAGLIVLLVVHRSQFDRLQAAAEAALADGLKADKDSPPRRPDAEEALARIAGQYGGNETRACLDEAMKAHKDADTMPASTDAQKAARDARYAQAIAEFETVVRLQLYASEKDRTAAAAKQVATADDAYKQQRFGEAMVRFGAMARLTPNSDAGRAAW